MSLENVCMGQCSAFWSDVFIIAYKESGSVKEAAIQADMALQAYLENFGVKREVN